MADTQGSWSFTDVKNKSGVVTSRTGTYKIGTTTAATITGLSPTVTESNITVNDTNGTIQLSASAFGTSSVKLEKGNYTLGFLGDVPGMNGIEITGPTTAEGVQLSNPTMTVSNGTLTVTGTLKAGYTLAANKKSIAYSAEKKNTTLAKITGLNTSLVAGTDDDAGKIGISTTDGETTTFTEAVTLDGKTITFTQDALKAGSVAFAKNGNVGGYSFALSGVAAPSIGGSGTWTVNTSKGTATYTDTITAGHTLSLDGKTVNYTAPQETAKALVTVSGVNKTATADDFSIAATTGDTYYGATITLSSGALTTGTVSVGAGYKLALDGDVSQDPEATDNIWAVNKTTATYKQITPAYYSYDADTNKVLYNKQADIQTYATVTGLKSGLTVTEGAIEGITLGTIDGNGDFTADSSGKVIQLTGGDDGVLTGTNVKVTGTGYTLALEDATAPTTENEVWSVSGTTATLKGKITAGWTQTDDTTITYVKANNNGVIATVKGLAKSLKAVTTDGSSAVGTYKDDPNGEVDSKGKPLQVFVPGLLRNEDGTIIVAANVAGTTDITLTPTAGIESTLVLDDGNENSDNHIADGGGAVTTTAKNGTFWVINGAALNLKDGKEAFYTLDGNTVKYTAQALDKTIATVKGLRTDLKVDSEYDIDGIEVNDSDKEITLDSSVLNGKDVTITGSGKYLLSVSEDLNPEAVNRWTVVDKIAYFKTYDSEGYTVADQGARIAYTGLTEKKDVAIISGLKSNIKANSDGTITGIKIGTTDPSEGTFSEDADGSEIQLAKGVLGTTDIELTNKNGNTYKLALASGESEQSYTWSGKDVKNTYGQVTCKIVTPAGFVIDGAGTTAAYQKSSTVNVTISGLAVGTKDAIASDKKSIDGIGLADGVFTLDNDLLNGMNVTITGGDYKIALAKNDAPTFVAGSWETVTKKNVTTATLYGTVSEEGYQTAANGKTINYFAETNDTTDPPETVVLATITGLNGNVTANANGTITGITLDNATIPTKFTLSKEVLGTSNVAVSGGNYTLDLVTGTSDATRNVPTETVHTIGEWVTSGTTATFKEFDKGYYTLDDSKSTLKYTADTKGTTYATLKGFVSGTDINGYYNTSNKTVTLNEGQLGTSKVTLTGTGYKLALGTAPTSASPTLGWVTSGTTATYKNYTPGYYKLSGNTINYTAATKGTTIATIKGIKSGAEITAGSSKEITLSADQLGTSKVTISGDGYTLKLGDGVTDATSSPNYEWAVTDVKNKSGDSVSTTAAYNQVSAAGYTLAADSRSITYSATPTTKTLATIKGLAPNIGEDDLESGIIPGTDSDTGIKVLKLSDDDILGDKVTLTSSEYVFAMDNKNVAAPAQEADSEVWVLNKSKGTAAYQVTMGEGFSLAANGKTITKIAEKDTTLLTLSGLDKTALAETFFGEVTGNTAEVASIDGITVDTEHSTVTLGEDAESLLTKKVSLGAKDAFAFVLNGLKVPTAYTDPKWTVSTVKGTTKAVLRNGMEAGYELTNANKTLVLTAEKAGDTVATLTGLVKGLKVSDDKQTLYFTNSDKTTSPAVSYNSTAHTIALYAPALGTSDIALESDVYTIGTMNGTAPNLNKPAWTFSNGKATYSQVQEAGYELSDDKKSVSYTAAKTTTLATISGLDKTFSEDVNDFLDVDTKNVVTVHKDILGTSKVTISVPKNSAAYTLALYGDVAEQPELQKAQWVTNGTTAQYKDYYDAYYLVATGNKAITYNKPKDVKVYATVKGIASGADLSSALSGDTNGGTITLDSTMLGNSNVTLTSLKGTSFQLALGEGVYQTDDERKAAQGDAWVTSGSTATYMTDYTPAYYTNNTAGNKITYYKGVNGTAAASITGVSGKLTAVTLDSATSTFTVDGNQLSSKITVDGKGEYAFNITSYSDATINGSANADTITAAGNKLSISTGGGDDSITFSGSYVTVTGGAGDDVINASGKSSNVFVYNSGEGDDIINNYAKNDALTIKGFNTTTSYTGGNEISVPVKNSDPGTITLNWANDTAPSSILINGTSYSTNTSDYESASNVLLADDNYSMDAASLSDLVQPDSASFTPYDFDGGFSLTKEDKLTPQVSYSDNDK